MFVLMMCGGMPSIQRNQDLVGLVVEVVETRSVNPFSKRFESRLSEPIWSVFARK